MRSERLRERKPLTHKTGIKWVKCCGAAAFLKTYDRAKFEACSRLKTWDIPRRVPFEWTRLVYSRG